MAVILAGADPDLTLALIRRTTRPDDRWSGQMAFPGGRGDARDAHPRATAERETREEIGLAIDADAFIGALPDVRLRREGLPVSGILSPYVYFVGHDHPALRPDPTEVDGAWWVPLAHCWDEANWTHFDWRDGDLAMRFPGIAHGPDVVWGLTYRVLTTFGEVCGLPALPAYER